MGSLLSSLLSGEILHDTEGYGIIFFVFGALGLVWNILFVCTVYHLKFIHSTWPIKLIPFQHFTVTNKPENHPRICDEEKDYLNQEIGKLTETRKISHVPWCSLLTSKPVWALIIAQLGHDWALFFIGSYISKFFRNYLGLSFKTSGRFIALAYLIAWIFSIFCGYVGGFLISRKIITITRSRKFFTFLCK